MKNLSLILVLIIAMVAISGCRPEGMVDVDTDGDGVVDAKAWVDPEGKPLVNPDGSLQIVPLSSGYAVADTVDTVGPMILKFAAGAGYPIVAAIAALWMKRKWGRVAMDLVMNIQTIRDTFNKDKKFASALSIADNILAHGGPATKAFVEDAKHINNLYLDPQTAKDRS